MAGDNVVLVFAGNNMIIAIGVQSGFYWMGLCSSGRNLAYKELGVHKEEARYKIVISHGIYRCKDMDLPISQVPHYHSSFTHQSLHFRTHY